MIIVAYEEMFYVGLLVFFFFLGLGVHGMGARTLTDSVGPSLARIMEQCHVGQPIAIIHMAASTQNLRVPGTREGYPNT